MSRPTAPMFEGVASVDAEVRYAETDAMGIVHHSNYLVWLEIARTELCRTGTGIHYADIERTGYRLTVTSVEVRYREPARYGDTVTIRAWIDSLASRRVRFAYDVRRADRVLASAATEHVWIDLEGRPRRIPEALAPSFRDLVRGSEPPQPADRGPRNHGSNA